MMKLHTLGLAALGVAAALALEAALQRRRAQQATTDYRASLSPNFFAMKQHGPAMLVGQVVPEETTPESYRSW